MQRMIPCMVGGLLLECSRCSASRDGVAGDSACWHCSMREAIVGSSRRRMVTWPNTGTVSYISFSVAFDCIPLAAE
ncbi:hypothetical protein GQ44DRAFT_709100 [Phaeosphaeriaceae sp. PMI808]|nr:hypothetical protein GQ44DRAFT_709100 [Phaeosphaeriaceae sp. PMI808]